MRSRRFRLLAGVMAGGVLFQVGGCASGLVPVGLSVLESVVLRTFFLQVFGL